MIWYSIYLHPQAQGFGSIGVLRNWPHIFRLCYKFSSWAFKGLRKCLIRLVHLFNTTFIGIKKKRKDTRAYNKSKYSKVRGFEEKGFNCSK